MARDSTATRVSCRFNSCHPLKSVSKPANTPVCKTGGTGAAPVRISNEPDVVGYLGLMHSNCNNLFIIPVGPAR
jgi:hypothetical protein